MAYEIKENTFSLFENDKKGNDKAPDYKGKGKVSGVEVKIAVWKRTSQSGIEYLSGVVEETTAENSFGNPATVFTGSTPKEESKGAVDDTIPF